MQYLLLVYADERTGPEPDSTEEEVMWVAHDDFSRLNGEAIVEGKALHPSDTATTVRTRAGTTLTADGPMVPTGDQLTGFYLIEADDLDSAIDTASRVPCAGHGAVEVRPVVDSLYD